MIELLPEAEFIALYGNPGNVMITVMVPRSEADLEQDDAAQTITVTVESLLSTIKEVKDKLCAKLGVATTGRVSLAANKIQLKDAAAGFLKDTNTLASYNINTGSTMDMSLRSRGGRK